jgi:hypothetical protein
MAARQIYNIGGQSVSHLDGNEVIRVENASQSIKLIHVRDFQRYVGGDTSVPSLRLERGTYPRKISDFPNAEFDFKQGDLVTGVQDGDNVNFHLRQILRPLMDIVRELIAEEVTKALKK